MFRSIVVRLVLSCAGVLMVSGAFAGAASAEMPWWHLNSGSRPAYLHAGAGKPEVPGEPELQEITLALEGGKGGLELDVGTSELGLFAYPEEFATEVGVPPLTAAALQSALEGPYGAGKVTVTEHIEGETLSFKVKSPFGSTPIVVNGAGIGTPEAKVISPGTKGTPATTDGELYLTAENIGDANVEGAFNRRTPIPCSLEESGGTQIAKCTVSEALAPYDQILMRIGVNVEPGAEGSEQVNEVSVSGGGAQSSSLRRKVTISSAPVPFGVESYEMTAEEEGGAPTAQAGKHPFQLNTTIALNQLADISPLSNPEAKAEVAPAALAKDLSFKLPPGLIGNPSPIAQCTTAQFFETVGGQENRCPPDSAVGVAVATVHEPTGVGTVTVTEPVFNLQPREGEPARFGFYVVIANSPVFIDTSVRSGSDYGVTVNVQNITQTAGFLSSEVTFWGTPSDPSHDAQRGWGCIYAARGAESVQPCTPAAVQHPEPFLTMPTRCAGSLGTNVTGDSWPTPETPSSLIEFAGQFEPAEALGGCNRLQFEPEIKVAPDGQEASKPTGLTVDVHVPQEINENSAGNASSNVKDITVAFPKGVVVNPSSADGLKACPESLVGLQGGTGAQGEFLFTPYLPGTPAARAAGDQEPFLQGQNFCADASKVGTVTIKSPLLPKGQYVNGSLYLATPAPNGEAGMNPFNSLIATYIVAEDPISGTLVKLPGKVTLDPNTGQIVSTFENNPQLAFEDAEIHLFGGERAPFATPGLCGTYETQATFTPWSGTPPVTSKTQFQITSGPNGTPCPSNPLPFNASLTGGTTNNNAGSFTPMTTTITREDGQQDIGRVQLKFPPGLSGILTGVPLCGEAQANAGTCSEASKIGETIVSVGLGGDPFSVTGGKVYLTGPYHGAPFGLSIVNPAVAGPFNLGQVIVRAKIAVDPITAALTVTTNSENEGFSIPHILDGIPLQIKHVNVTITRPGFTFNPTSCNPMSITGNIGSDQGASSPVSVGFQVANCERLAFKPSFKVSTNGKTSRKNGASLKVKLAYPKAPFGSQANIRSVKVNLPRQLPSRLTTLQKACTHEAFEADPARCPAASKVGFAKATTPLLPVQLEGPAYFVSYGGAKFPELVIVLQGYGVTVDLHGETFINEKTGITSSTFRTVPDVPVGTFELNLPQGKYSALGANGSLCYRTVKKGGRKVRQRLKLVMPTAFTAQNGKVLKQSTAVSVGGCPKLKAKGKGKAKKKK